MAFTPIEKHVFRGLSHFGGEFTSIESMLKPLKMSP